MPQSSEVEGWSDAVFGFFHPETRFQKSVFSSAAIKGTMWTMGQNDAKHVLTLKSVSVWTGPQQPATFTRWSKISKSVAILSLSWFFFLFRVDSQPNTPLKSQHVCSSLQCYSHLVSDIKDFSLTLCSFEQAVSAAVPLTT